MRNLILVRGLPGSGKTTLARAIVSASAAPDAPGSPCWPMYAADDYFMVGGEYRFDGTKLAQAHKSCQDNAARSMGAGSDIIVAHNTFVSRWEMEPYFRLAAENSYEVTVVSVFDGGLSDKELADRNTHGVPLHAIARMRANFEHDWRVGDTRPPWGRK